MYKFKGYHWQELLEPLLNTSYNEQDAKNQLIILKQYIMKLSTRHLCHHHKMTNEEILQILGRESPRIYSGDESP